MRTDIKTKGGYINHRRIFTHSEREIETFDQILFCFFTIYIVILTIFPFSLLGIISVVEREQNALDLRKSTAIVVFT